MKKILITLITLTSFTFANCLLKVDFFKISLGNTVRVATLCMNNAQVLVGSNNNPEQLFETKLLNAEYKSVPMTCTCQGRSKSYKDIKD